MDVGKQVDAAYDEAAKKEMALAVLGLAGDQLFDPAKPVVVRVAALEHTTANMWKAAMLTNRIDQGQNTDIEEMKRRITALEITVAKLNGGTVQAA